MNAGFVTRRRSEWIMLVVMTMFLIMNLFLDGSSVMAQAVSTTTTTAPSNPFPVVLWHGMGDSCCFPFVCFRIRN